MMFGTVIGFIVAVVFSLVWQDVQGVVNFSSLNTTLVVAGSLFLFLAYNTMSRVWNILQKVEKESFPYAQEIFLKDWRLSFSLLFLFLFAFFSYFIVFADAALAFSIVKKLFIAWMFFCGVAFDLMQFSSRRVMHYSYYPFLLDHVSKKCLHYVEKGKEAEAIVLIDGFLEIINKSTKQGNCHIAIRGLDCLLDIVEGYVAAAGKSLLRDPVRSSETSFLDRVNYISVYLAKRFEWIFKTSLLNHVDPVTDEVLSVYAKMSLYFTKYHPTLSLMPLNFIEKCAKYALENKREDVLVQAGVILSELAKNFIHLSQEKQVDLSKNVLAAILHLEELTRSHFQKNKETSPLLLMQPFAEIGQFIGEVKEPEFQGKEAILVELRRILGEYSALDTVKQNLQVQK